MSDLPDMKVHKVTVFIRNESAALTKVFDPPVSNKEANEWVDQNIMLRFENLDPVKLFD